MTPEDERAFEHAMAERAVTQMIGALSLMRPDLLERFDPAEVREIVRDELRRDVAAPIPDVFRRAFEGEDR